MHYYKNCKELSSVFRKQFKGNAYFYVGQGNIIINQKIFY